MDLTNFFSHTISSWIRGYIFFPVHCKVPPLQKKWGIFPTGLWTHIWPIFDQSIGIYFFYQKFYYYNAMYVQARYYNWKSFTINNDCRLGDKMLILRPVSNLYPYWMQRMRPNRPLDNSILMFLFIPFWELSHRPQFPLKNYNSFMFVLDLRKRLRVRF